MKMRKALSLLLAMLLIVSVFAGCSNGATNNGNANNNGETNNSNANNNAEPANDNANNIDNGAEEPKGDGWLDVNFTGLTSLTCFLTNGGRNWLFFDMMFEPLAMMDVNKELVAVGASDWSTTDNLTYTVNLKENITDSAGNHITASDVVWFIKEAQNQALKPVFNMIKSVEQTGDYSLTFTLNSNVVGTFELVMEDTWLISQKAYEESADHFATELISTAPYVVTSFVPSGDMKLERRDDYWQDYEALPPELRPAVEKVYFHCITEVSQVGIALETGLIDIAVDPEASVATTFIDNPNFTVERYDGQQGFQIFFSGYEDRPVAEDVKLRQAICYAIDNEGLIDAFAYGYGSPMYDVCTSFAVGYDPDWENDDYYGYNPDKARELLAESNYDGTPLIFLCLPNLQRVAEVIQACLSDVGINMEIYSPELALAAAIRFDGSKYDIFINSVGCVYLPDHWSIRYDPNAYPTGDATSRHDYVLAELLYKTWTVEGYTKENINEVHEYLKDNAIAYGLFNGDRFCVWSNRIQLVEPVECFVEETSYFASTWKGI